MASTAPAASFRLRRSALRGAQRLAGLWLALGALACGASAAQISEARVEEYKKGAHLLREEAARRGSIRYSDVVALVYGEAGLDAETLAAKAAWRNARGGAEIFWTDYDTVEASVPVRVLDELPSDDISSLVGMYFPRRNLIKLSAAGDPFVALHESGHALQRKSLRRERVKQSGNAAWNDLAATVSARSRGEGVSPDFIERLQYLVSQDEFEVRLQDLNRFYAVAISGRPILDERDAVKALLGLGMSLGFAEVSAACEGAGIAMSEADFASLQQDAAAAPRSIARNFADAGELLVLRRLARDLDETLWQVALRKILLEAPGHY